MVQLTFGEQVKVILSRKGMTIKELAELVEQHTGKPMSRQNMTQRLGRDNFQEQDMRMIAEILGCHFTLSIMEPSADEAMFDESATPTRDITVGELVQMPEELKTEESIIKETVDEEVVVEESTEPEVDKPQSIDSEEKSLLRKGIKGYFRKSVAESQQEAKALGEINPYTGKEYQSNSVRMHPKRIGYVQVYDQEQHKWTDMTEWAFLGYQERKKKLLGKDYRPPIYLD